MLLTLARRIGIILLLSVPSFAATYYVAMGATACGGSACSDSNNGTTKTTAWLHAPGMANCTNTCNATTPAGDDSIIFRIGDTWTNASFSWSFKSSGTAGHLIYYGVDPTWTDGSARTRPIFNLGNASPTDSLFRIILLNKSFITLDNFEIVNVACLPSATNGTTTVFDWFDNSETNVLVENMYVHGWNNPVFAIGTGNAAASGTSVTNFVPYSYSPAVVTTWPTTYSGVVRVQSIPAYLAISSGNSSPTVTSITGTNPYTINFTESPSNTGPGCTGCTFQIGGDYCLINGGVEGAQTNNVFQNNVIDGLDTAEAQLNPFSDCGFSESNNQFCLSSATAGFREPNIWRGNVVQYVASAFVGSCYEWSTNLIQNLRLGTDPTNHTNGIECVDDFPVNNATFFYSNVVRHTTNPNTNTPGGQYSIGLGAVLPNINVGETAYLFNNVFYDVLQNAVFERGTNTGNWKIFNNTADCGPSWSLTFPCVNSGQTGDLIENNYFVTTNGSPIGAGGTVTNNLIQTPTVATGQGYTPNQTFAYFPTLGGSTIGNGVSLASLCTTIAAIQSAAGTACLSDTPYAVGYNAVTHAPIIPGRTTATHGSTWDQGGYQFAGTAGITPSGSLGNGAKISGGAVIR